MTQTTEQRREYQRKRQKENPEYYREKSRQYRARNPEKSRAAVKRWNSKRYPVPDHPAPPLCECCGKPPGVKALALDHDHVTGCFRGWLCTRCNTGIGSLGDSLAGVQRAAAYLQRSEAT